MAADLSHLLSVEEIKHKYEKTLKDIFAIYQQQKEQENYASPVMSVSLPVMIGGFPVSGTMPNCLIIPSEHHTPKIRIYLNIGRTYSGMFVQSKSCYLVNCPKSELLVRFFNTKLFTNRTDYYFQPFQKQYMFRIQMVTLLFYQICLSSKEMGFLIRDLT